MLGTIPSPGHYLRSPTRRDGTLARWRRSSIHPGKLPRPTMVAACLALVLATPSVATAQVEPADVILHSGRLWTGAQDGAYAQALAIRGNEIVAVGTDAEVMGHRGDDTRVIDLEGRFVTPGFIDNHTHFNRAGELLLGVNLLEVSDA
ncbi:MAG: amidohydrolase family protein, partial [Gemmatimonadetes bacterium]|nr:amidohydrolase family protein [Gemmatimonadota bacterium]